MTQTSTVHLFALSFFTALACATEPGESAGESAAEAETDASEDAETEQSEPELPLARGVSITQIEANQGVAVALTEGADWVDGAGRNARLIAERPTLVRVHYVVDPGWVPRELAAQLVLELDDGASVVLEQRREVSDDSWPGSLDRTFNFELLPELGHTDPEVRFQVSLRETSDEVVGDSEGVPQSPSGAPAFVGFEALELLPEIVVVPLIDPDYEPPEPIPLDQLEQRLWGWLPAPALAFEIHEPLVVDASSWPTAVISELRAAESPAPDVSYIGIIPVADDGENTGYTGIVSEADPSLAENRYGVAFWRGDLDELSATMAWIMHSHHTATRVRCPEAVGPGDVDPLYPYADGKIGVWGFDISTGRVYNPNVYYDVTSFCAPKWVSDYSWNRFIASLRITSSW